jgi:hypothetical protein
MGSWVIDEIADNTKDPAVSYGQGGLNYEDDHFDGTLTANYYNFHHIRGLQLDHTSCSNSGLTLNGLADCSGTISVNFRDTGASLELGYRRLIHEEFKRIALFGDFIHNDWASKKLNKAYAYGVKLGDMAIDEARDWQLRYQFTRLGQDAVPDILPDSSRYDGQTGVRGINIELDVGLSRNVTFGLEYYRDKKINGEPKLPASVYQADLEFKF